MIDQPLMPYEPTAGVRRPAEGRPQRMRLPVKVNLHTVAPPCAPCTYPPTPAPQQHHAVQRCAVSHSHSHLVLEPVAPPRQAKASVPVAHGLWRRDVHEAALQADTGSMVTQTVANMHGHAKQAERRESTQHPRKPLTWTSLPCPFRPAEAACGQRTAVTLVNAFGPKTCCCSCNVSPRLAVGV